MDEFKLFPNDIDVSTRVLFLNFGKIESDYCLSLVKKLRDNNINTELYPASDKIKKQMTYANNKEVEFVVIVGEDEMNSGKLSVKNMKTGDQKNMSMTDLINLIK